MLLEALFIVSAVVGACFAIGGVYVIYAVIKEEWF